MKKKKQKHTRTQRKFEAEVVETKDFSAKVVHDEKGRNMLQINAPVWYRHQLQKFKTGETVTLYVSSRRPKRTQSQNNYLWGVYYPLIAKETGERNLDRLHELFKGMFLTSGIVDVLGHQVRIKKSSASLSISEFCEFVSAIENETGIQAPPTENWELSPFNNTNSDTMK